MVGKTKIEINLLLPDVADARDACVKRLADLLAAKEGVDAAHALEAEGERPGQLCIHYEPNRLTIGEVRELAKRAGAEIHERFGHLLLRTEPMHARRARTVAARAERLRGVLEASASADGMLRIEFDREKAEEDAIRAALLKSGVRVITEKRANAEAAAGEEEHDHEHGGLFGEQTELIYAIICGGLLLAGWLLSVLTNITPSVPWAIYLAAYFFGGFFTLREAIENIRVGRFEIDFLMLVAAIGAASLGEWAEGALLLFLFSLGHALEHYAMGRARRAIEALAELAPEFALVRRNGNTDKVPVEQLERGDVVIVKPNDRIPADGFVIKGESSVNQAPITGESVPVDKRPVDDPQRAAENPDRLDAQHRVFAGTINESGALEIVVTKLSTESTLARVVEMVSEAETQKSPTQRFTDKFERYFVPVVLGFVVLLLLAWVVNDEPFSASFYRAMAVLVAASPCALAIATPSAVLSGVARAARGGVLVKGGAQLEHLGRLGAIAFDKTGTLTEGKPRLTDAVSFDDASETELLRVAVAVETLSDHPLATAVARDGMKRLESRDESQEQYSGSGLSTLDSRLPEAGNMQSITGRGVKATIDGKSVYIGKDDLFRKWRDRHFLMHCECRWSRSNPLGAPP